MPDLALFRPRDEGIPSLETCLVSTEWFGLTTASPLQRAICRILDGLPLGELATDPGVIEALGGIDAMALLPPQRCVTMVLLAGIRSGKSLLAALVGTRAALSCDVSGLGPGESPTVSIVSLSMREARKTFAHVRGRISASPRLRERLVGEPLSDSLILRHPTGRPVKIAVTAGTRAAGSLIGDWSAGAIFDEAPRMIGEDDGVVNLDEARRALSGRMLPGAQIILSGSAYQPFGPVYDLVKKHHGKPDANIVVVRATGPTMNPAVWTPQACEELKQRDPDAYVVDVLTQFHDPESGIFGEGELRMCSKGRALLEAPTAERHYIAAMDAGTRGNSWTLVVASRREEGRLVVDLAHQWTGNSVEKLSSRMVFEEMAELLAPYRVTTVMADDWSADALQELAAERKLWLVCKNLTRAEKNEGMRVLRDALTDGKLSLPPDDVLLRDLHTVKKWVDEQGPKIHLPQTRDGRHCDYAPSLMKVAISYLQDPDPPATPPPDTEAGQLALRAAEKEAARLDAERRIKNRDRGLRRQIFGR